MFQLHFGLTWSCCMLTGVVRVYLYKQQKLSARVGHQSADHSTGPRGRDTVSTTRDTQHSLILVLCAQYGGTAGKLFRRDTSCLSTCFPKRHGATACSPTTTVVRVNHNIATESPNAFVFISAATIQECVSSKRVPDFERPSCLLCWTFFMYTVVCTASQASLWKRFTSQSSIP